MRRRVLIVLAALVLAGLSAMAVVVYARGADRRAVAEREGVYVLLATERIPAGTTGAQIRQRGLADRVLMPASTVPRGTLGDFDSSLDRLRVDSDLAPQQLLMRGLFSAGGNTSDQVGVPKDKIGVSVEVAMAPGVAEKVAAGDRVTVFVTYPRNLPPSEQSTRILLPEALVVSITAGPPSDVAPTPTPTGRSTAYRGHPVTLAVDQRDAVRLVHATQTGSIWLGLVGTDTSVTPAPGVSQKNLW
jgi:pilus assembly protein CpaB